jgi:hypothetical protein
MALISAPTGIRRARRRHTGQHVAGGAVLGVENAAVALDLALDDPCPAGAAHAGPTQRRDGQTVGFGGVEERLSGGRRRRLRRTSLANLERLTAGIDGVTCRAGRSGRRRDRRLEALRSHLIGGHAHRLQRRGEAVDHRLRSADHRDGMADLRCHGGDEPFVDAATVDVGGPLPSRHREADLQLVVTPAQRDQLVPERELADVAGRIEQGHGTGRFDQQRMPQHAHERRDADAAGQQHQRPIVAARIREVASRGADTEEAARTGQGMKRVRHLTLATHRDLEVAAGGRRGAERVAAHHVLAVATKPDGQELTGREIEAVGTGQTEGLDVGALDEDGEHRGLHEAAGTPVGRSSRRWDCGGTC